VLALIADVVTNDVLNSVRRVIDRIHLQIILTNIVSDHCTFFYRDSLVILASTLTQRVLQVMILLLEN
jgi:hypothetical protein